MAKVLVIDDEPEFVSMICAKLKKEGVDGIGFENAKEGLSYLKQNKDGVNLLVLDLLMPEMSGWVFINEMKKSGIDKLPVIVLTNLSHTDLPGEVDMDIEMVVKTDISMRELAEKIKQKLGNS